MPVRDIDYEKMNEEISRSGDLPIFSSVIRWLNRPGDAVGAILSGDLPSAARSAGQFLADIPTGGFLDPALSPVDLAGVRDRYGAERVMRHYGIAPSSTAGGQFVESLGIDMLKDPLSWVTFGGGLGKAAITGLDRAATASRLVGAMSQTAGGRALIAGMKGMDDLARAGALEKRFGMAEGALDRLAPELAEQILGRAGKEGLVQRADSLRFTPMAMVPFSDQGAGFPIMDKFWERAWGVTLPGMAQKALTKLAPEFEKSFSKKAIGAALPGREQTVTNALLAQANRAARTFYDKTLTGVVTEPVQRAQHVAEMIQGKTAFDWQNWAAEAANLLRGKSMPIERASERFNQPLIEFIGERMQRASDAWDGAVGEPGAYGMAKSEREALRSRLQGELEDGLPPEAVKVVRDYQARMAKAIEQKQAFGVWEKGKTPIWDLTNEDIEAPFQAAINRLATASENGRLAPAGSAAEAEYKAALKGFEKAASDKTALKNALMELREAKPQNYEQAAAILGQRLEKILNAGVGLKIENPFYMPRQLKDEVAAAMPRGRGLFDARPGVRSIFSRRREYGSTQEWVDAVAKRAKLEGATDDEIMGLMGEAEGVNVADVAELDLSKLALRYGDHHGRELGRAHLRSEAKLLGVRPGTPADEWVREQWEKLGARKNVIQRNVARLNRYMKPAATVFWPAYHVRNAISAIVATALDPDLTLADGLMAAAEMVRMAPSFRPGGKLGLNPSQVEVFMRAAGGDPEAIAKAVKLTVGGRSGQEVLDHVVSRVVSRAGGEADLFDSAVNMERLRLEPTWASLTPEEKAKQFLPRAEKLAYSLAAYTENSFRLNSFFKLLEKGHDPTDAATRVGKIYATYGIQSAADRALRDFMPFIRFQIAMTEPVIKALARRPGGVVPQAMRQAQAQFDQEPGDVQLQVPEYAKRGMIVPTGGGSYLSGLGLPQEAVAQNLEAIPSPGRGFSGLRAMGAQLNPMIRFPLEAATGKNLFTGGEFGATRSKPFLYPGGFPGVRTFESPDGKTIQEVPGWVNDVIRSIPGGRLFSTTNALSRDDKSTLDQIGIAFGLPTVSPDQRMGVAKALAAYLDRKRKEGKVGEIRHWWPRIARGEELPEDLKQILATQEELAQARRKRNRK